MHHKSHVIWLTGLSGSGKTTLALALAQRLKQLHIKTELLDGDVIREIFPMIGFTKSERIEHSRRVGYTASLLEKNNITVICSLISPYAEGRDFVRKITRNFVEVHLSTPLEICESRDPKGLYKKARTGQIKNFTGIDDPYEQPLHPELRLDTSTLNVEECVNKIINHLLQDSV